MDWRTTRIRSNRDWRIFGRVRDILPSVAGALQLDLSADNPGLSAAVVTRRAIVFLLWLLAFLGLVALIGMLPATFAFVALYMRVEGRERWQLVLTLAVGLTVFDYIVFDQLLALPWPRTVLGTWVPGLKPFLPSL